MRDHGLHTLAPRMRARVQSELRPGERIVWCAPQLPLWRWQISLPSWIFGSAFIVLSLYFALALALGGMPGVPPLGAGELAGGFGLLFGGTLAFTFLVGVVILLLPTVVLPRWYARTANVLTNQRAMLLGEHLFLTNHFIRSWERGEVVQVVPFVRRDGSGDIDFDLRGGRTEPLAPGGWSSTSPAKSPFGGAGFPGVGDAARIAELTRQHLVCTDSSEDRGADVH